MWTLGVSALKKFADTKISGYVWTGHYSTDLFVYFSSISLLATRFCREIQKSKKAVLSVS